MNPEAAPGQPANANPPDQPEAANVLLRRFEVRMPKEQLTKELDELAARTSREAKLPGFRQGKVPVEVVKKVYKKALEEEIVSQTLGRLASQHIRSQNLQIIGQPLAEKVDYQEGQDLRADIVVEVFPDFEFPALSTLEVPVPKADWLKPAKPTMRPSKSNGFWRATRNGCRSKSGKFEKRI